MLIAFFLHLRNAGLPVTIREFLDLLAALQQHLAEFTLDNFYYLSRTVLVKDESLYDRFDQAFAQYLKGAVAENQSGISEQDLPEDWLRKLAERHLSDEEKKLIESLGGFEKLMETLQQRLKEQHERHQGGNRWIGTAGTSPFGAYGYNPEGVRIGQDQSRHRRAVKVWDKRTFRNFDHDVELGTRNIKVALKRLRQFARTGASEVLDMPDTIRSTARNGGMLDVKMVPERHNAAKVLLFFDVGGSMDDHIRICEQLFSAAHGEFKHLEYFYFHNCIYETLWKDNHRRYQDNQPTWDVLNKFGRDYSVIFVGDASMSPYEISHAGGSVEHWNQEAGGVWLKRVLETFPKAIWLNPVAEQDWEHVESIHMVRQLMEQRMYPLTLAGLDEGIRALARKA